MTDSQTEGLTHLGSSGTEYPNETGVNPKLLERFPNPMKERLMRLQAAGHGYKGTIHIEVPEFTSLCPLTGQPDFANIIIDYVPDQWCVESKSLKLYMFSFRGEGEFHEACTARIASDIFELLEPFELTVFGEFTPRGGIPFQPLIHMVKDLGKMMPQTAPQQGQPGPLN